MNCPKDRADLSKTRLTDFCFGKAHQHPDALTEVIEAIQKRIDGIFVAYKGETNEKVTEHAFTMADGLGEAINIIKEVARLRSDRK